MGRSWKSFAWLGVGLALAGAGCGGGELWSPPGCASDADCKHGRVCIEGACQDAPRVCLTDLDCPAGFACVGGACVLCDQDRDGAEALRCGGADCDDQNAGVHPGARELCGDGLDNDCDGQTDPAAQCADKCATVRCSEGYACDPATGACVPICAPACAGRACGPDGCGGVCGACAPGERCTQAGQCVSECVPDCAGRECGPDPVCGLSCGSCAPGTSCDDRGQCVGACWPECDSWGQTSCLDEVRWAECGDWDGDNCLEWGPGQVCPEDSRCDPWSGTCVGECWDECPWGETTCWDERSEASCWDWDGDGCAEWGAPTPCPEGVCDWATGRCAESCQDECPWGQLRCTGLRRYVVCGQFDHDTCAEWSPEPQRCPAGTTCSQEAGGCVGDCQDECAPGERVCLDLFTWVDCGEHDGDPCLEFGPPLPCPADLPCDWNTGTCEGGGGAFGAPCADQAGCQDGLTCTRVDEAHLGYCNRPCSNAAPCPQPFQCFSVEGQSWCVALCGGQESCASLGAWECVWFSGVPTGVCLPLTPVP